MLKEATEHAWYALHEPLRAFFRKRVRDEEVVEDVLQDVFLWIHTQLFTISLAVPAVQRGHARETAKPPASHCCVLSEGTASTEVKHCCS